MVHCEPFSNRLLITLAKQQIKTNTLLDRIFNRLQFSSLSSLTHWTCPVVCERASLRTFGRRKSTFTLMDRICSYDMIAADVVRPVLFWEYIYFVLATETNS